MVGGIAGGETSGYNAGHSGGEVRGVAPFAQGAAAVGAHFGSVGRLGDKAREGIRGLTDSDFREVFFSSGFVGHNPFGGIADPTQCSFMGGDI